MLDMKTHNILLYSVLRSALPLLAAAALACTADPIAFDAGSDKPFDPVGNARPAFHSAFTVRDSVARVWVEPGSKFEDVLSFGMTKTRSEDLTVTISLVDDPDLLATANNYYSFADVDIALNGGIAESQRIKRGLIFVPAENISVPTGSKVIPTGTSRIDLPISIDLKVAGTENNSSFLTILRAEFIGDDGTVERLDFYYELLIDPVSLRQTVSRQKGHGDSHLEYAVTYIDPSWLDPRACLDTYLVYTDPATYQASLYEYCDATVILGGTVGYEAMTKMPKLDLSQNLSYLLLHRDKYLKPIQDAGIAVTIEITGSGTGLGFCNLDDAQRASLVEQIARVVSEYEIDGVNLNDELTGYGKAGMPEIDPASYTRFIRDLKTALPGKIVTLTDIGEPAATLYEAHEGIEAGQYLDYAWTGVAADLTDPYAAGASRKPIAGLPRNRYGRFTARARDIGVWSEWLNKDESFDAVMEIALSNDPLIFVQELMPMIEGNETHTGANLGAELSFMLPWTENGDMPWLVDVYCIPSGSLRNPYAQYTLPGYANMLYYPDWLRY